MLIGNQKLRAAIWIQINNFSKKIDFIYFLVPKNDDRMRVGILRTDGKNIQDSQCSSLYNQKKCSQTLEVQYQLI